jgi:hypothetical protein
VHPGLAPLPTARTTLSPATKHVAAKCCDLWRSLPPRPGWRLLAHVTNPTKATSHEGDQNASDICRIWTIEKQKFDALFNSTHKHATEPNSGSRVATFSRKIDFTFRKNYIRLCQIYYLAIE